MTKIFYKVKLKKPGEIKDPIKARKLDFIRKTIGSLLNHSDNLKLVYGYLECSDSYYKLRENIPKLTTMPIVVYQDENGNIIEAIYDIPFKLEPEFVNLEELDAPEFARMLASMGEMSVLMYKESVNELVSILDKAQNFEADLKSDANQHLLNEQEKENKAIKFIEAFKVRVRNGNNKGTNK